MAIPSKRDCFAIARNDNAKEFIAFALGKPSAFPGGLAAFDIYGNMRCYYIIPPDLSLPVFDWKKIP